MSERKPVLTQEQVDECYDWADTFMRNHMRYPCPRCGFILPCCDPQE